MVLHYRKTAGPSSSGKEKKTDERQTGAGKDDECRCKEVSEMPPRKLLGLMINDLAFWKKAKKG